jgi:peptidoglycan/xylan/chitin deacetylase (PgdA/CDA1 family)
MPDKALFAFTFDDGFAECHSIIAPVLEEFGVNGAFFINPGFVGGDAAYIDEFLTERVATPGKTPMTWEQIRDLESRGHVIGAHTIDHIRLVVGDDNAIERQVVRCRTVIESEIERPCRFFAWPYGRLRDISLQARAAALEAYDVLFASDKYADESQLQPRILNRRHCEGDWPIEHLRYFLSKPPYGHE